MTIGNSVYTQNMQLSRINERLCKILTFIGSNGNTIEEKEKTTLINVVDEMSDKLDIVAKNIEILEDIILPREEELCQQ